MLVFYCSWNKGYSGGHAQFISQNVICYKTGNTIKFVDLNGKETTFSAQGEGGIGALAVHGINGVFAFSEKTVKPKITVMQYPTFLRVSEIKGENATTLLFLLLRILLSAANVDILSSFRTHCTIVCPFILFRRVILNSNSASQLSSESLQASLRLFLSYNLGISFRSIFSSVFGLPCLQSPYKKLVFEHSAIRKWDRDGKDFIF
jgi:hypothetical protein